VEKQNPVTLPVFTEANLLDVLGDAESGAIELEFPQFKEILAPADLHAHYLCAERLL
jgi:hypothetical protein